MIVSLSESDMLAQVRTFLLLVLPSGREVIRAQKNRVPQPVSKNWVLMTPRNRKRLALNEANWDHSDAAVSTMVRTQHMQVNIQLDVYGDTGADDASIISTVFADDYGFDWFKATNLPIRPLYATDGNQMPAVLGEQQAIDRWTMELALQANLTVSTDQQFLDRLTVDLINVDAKYPPGA